MRIKFIQKIINLIKNRNKVVGYEANIVFKNHYKHYGSVVIKQYRDDSECVNWLNEILKEYYPDESIIPVAQHEFRILSILSKYDIAPVPVELGQNYVIMKKFGSCISDEKKYKGDKKLYTQALKILETLEKLGIKHNDLLPRNILIDNKKQIKLIDFTLSEIENIKLMDKLPNTRWAYPNDSRILEYFR